MNNMSSGAWHRACPTLYQVSDAPDMSTSYSQFCSSHSVRSTVPTLSPSTKGMVQNVHVSFAVGPPLSTHPVDYFHSLSLFFSYMQLVCHRVPRPHWTQCSYMSWFPAGKDKLYQYGDIVHTQSAICALRLLTLTKQIYY